MKKSFSVLSALVLIAMATACAKSSPTQPSTGSTTQTAASEPTVVSTVDGATITSPVAVSPTDTAQIKYASQPITLTVNNAITTGKGSMTYTFEVATDSGFGSIKQTK